MGQGHLVVADDPVVKVRDVNRTVWTQLQKRAMAQPVGWDASAAVYAQLYESILRT